MSYPTVIHERVAQANKGECPNAVIRLRSGWVMVGDVQPVKGYCLLFSDPVVRDLNTLDEKARAEYLLDMTRVGDALLEMGADRINYETWGNVDRALHTHIVPRWKSEAAEARTQPIKIAYDWAKARKFDAEKDREFVSKLRSILSKFEV